jgi:hypothetical protein
MRLRILGRQQRLTSRLKLDLWSSASVQQLLLWWFLAKNTLIFSPTQQLEKVLAHIVSRSLLLNCFCFHVHVSRMEELAVPPHACRCHSTCCQQQQCRSFEHRGSRSGDILLESVLGLLAAVTDWQPTWSCNIARWVASYITDDNFCTRADGHPGVQLIKSWFIFFLFSQSNCYILQ